MRKTVTIRVERAQTVDSRPAEAAETPRALRVGLAWPATERLTNLSVRYERYVRGFQALGHDPVTVCQPSAAVGYSESVALASTESDLRDPGFWRSLRLDAVVAITWLGLADMVRAARTACPWVASVADSDGQVGVRVFPGVTFSRGVWQHRRLFDRLRAAKFWARRYLLRPESYDRPMLESTERANVIAVGSAQAMECLSRFFAYHRRPDLAARLAVIPYPVDPCFLTGEVPQHRQRRLVAVGRWDDPQKDAALLARAVARVLKASADVSFVLVGRGGERVFKPPCAQSPRVQYLGPQPPDMVAALLRDSRALLMSSRWEGAPVVVNEALCLGCTLVGPARIVGLRSYCQGGDFGTTSFGRSARGLAAAVLEEMKAWDEGRRDPRRIAAAWRPHFDPRTVCRQLLGPAGDVNGREPPQEADDV